MYYYLNGILAVKEPDFAVVECAGVGYKVRITSNTYKKLGEINSSVKIYTYLVVREDAMELYGFADDEEKNCYIMLISVSGIGPKIGLSVLSQLTPQQVAIAIATGDVKAISSAPGVGAKGAGRIILELKDKMAKQDIFVSNSGGNVSMSGNNINEAISALVVLGYTKTDIERAFKGQNLEGLEVEELIKIGLRQLMKL